METPTVLYSRECSWPAPVGTVP